VNYQFQSDAAYEDVAGLHVGEVAFVGRADA
jgi:hypothetical protein